MDADDAPLLDYKFRMPDCVWEQPAVERSARNGDDFAECGERRFVRCLLPVPVGAPVDDDFCLGIWVEVDAETFALVLDAWNDGDLYPDLEFQGRLANAVPWLAPEEGDVLGALVEVGVREVDERPFVVDAAEPWLARLLARGWDLAAYERAVAALLPPDDDESAVGEDPTDDPGGARAYLCGHVFRSERPALVVVHDEDGHWEFLCARCDPNEEGVHLVHAGHLFADERLAECRDLPPGHEAERTAAEAAWKRS